MKRFTRTKEDFVCEHCGAHVKGSGYTNHCPNCLWSKHVDINPGDRQAKCGGMMRPVDSIVKKGEYSVISQCEKCGYCKTNRLAENDNFDALLNIIKSKNK